MYKMSRLNDLPSISQTFFIVVEKSKTDQYHSGHLMEDEQLSVQFYGRKSDAIQAAKDRAKRTQRKQLLFVVNPYGRVDPQEPTLTEFPPLQDGAS